MSLGQSRLVRQPPLRALEVFEAAARHGNFTTAGREIGITPSAVSRQVSDLEATIGVRLFTRRGARLILTSAGTRLSERLARALGEVRAAVAEQTALEGVVTLSMLPSVAAKWFAPRLARFVAAHPDIDLRIGASRHLVDFTSEGIDAAIRYGTGPWPGLVARRLAAEIVRPVCTPTYLGDHAIATPADLMRATLLYGDIAETWPAWFAAAGCDQRPPTGPRLEDDTALLQAALDSQGVALGRSLLVAEDLSSGRLVAPFDIGLSAQFSYWFVRPEATEPSRALRTVETWIAAEFQSAAGVWKDTQGG